MSRTLYLIRHGESDRDSDRMFGSPRGDQWDPPLSAKGREQAELLAARLLVMDLDPFVIYASPMRRARETAEIFANQAGREIRFHDDLVEAHIGGWEARPFEEIVEQDPAIMHALRHQRPIWSRAPGAEVGSSFRQRVSGAIASILEEHPDDNALVFAHGGVVNAYCGDVLGLPQEMFFLPENASINSIDVDQNERRLRFLNDTIHLTDPSLAQWSRNSE